MNYLINKTQYLSAKQYWNKITNRSPSDHIIYNLIRGFDAKRGFTEITNRTKLSNGANPWAGFESAKADARWRTRPMSTKYTVGDVSYAEMYSARMKELSKEWGFEFTPDLMDALQEALK